LIRQTLIESALLATVGLLFGLFVGWISLGLLRSLASTTLSSALPGGIAGVLAAGPPCIPRRSNDCT
jgi:hypothetical protein